MPAHRVLALSFAFPPMPYPRAIQVPRLLAGLDASIVLLRGTEVGGRTDPTIGQDVSLQLEHVIEVPFARSRFRDRVAVLAQRVGLDMLLPQPDMYRSWVRELTHAYLTWEQQSRFRPDAVITFGMPMSDHLFGLAYKQRSETPWIAHFSDPWIPPPPYHDNALTRWYNRRLERQVLGAADAVIFTTPETVNFVMSEHPEELRRKAFHLPHIGARDLYAQGVAPPSDAYVVRHIGNFYGPRSPKGVLRILDRLAADKPQLFDAVRFEFVGPHSPTQAARMLAQYPHLQQHVHFVGAVPYAQSLRLMQSSHCLVVIDAPAADSVFLPSKLIDYIGSQRFVAAISPPGASSRVVGGVGGWVADPRNPDEVSRLWERILTERPHQLSGSTRDYDREVVHAELQRILASVL